MQLAQVASVLSGQLVSNDVEVSGVEIDSRRISPGDLFVALPGERVDGHDFLRAAQSAGAVAALVERPVDVALPQVVVASTTQAIVTLARWWRTQCSPRVVAITGSCGKTTTRALLAGILSQQGEGLATEGNFNNELGVPLTILRLQQQHQFAVFELGAKQRGDIKHLTHLVQPEVGVITNAAEAHIDGFGSVAKVAEGKGELFAHLPADGCAVINSDDDHFVYWCDVNQARRQLSVSSQGEADVYARNILISAQGAVSFDLVTPDAEAPIELALKGRHNVANAVAAAAAAYYLGVPLSCIQAGLASVTPVAGRMVHYPGPRSSVIIDDTYNANPLSMQAAIDVLAAYEGRRILVMADMLEQGAQAEAVHAAIGKQAQDSGIDQLYGFGALSRSAVNAFGPAARHFDCHDTLLRVLMEDISAATVVLVKGSNSMNMRHVVEQLI